MSFSSVKFAWFMSLVSEIRVRGEGQLLIGGAVPVGITLPTHYWDKVEKESELRVRGNGQIMVTGGRGPAGIAIASWARFATAWTVAPVFNSSISGGDVYDYTYGSTTYYRFVPSAYDPSQDAFYDTFSSGLLSGEIANRGYSIA
jgi:hypothetical protein